MQIEFAENVREKLEQTAAKRQLKVEAVVQTIVEQYFNDEDEDDEQFDHEIRSIMVEFAPLLDALAVR
ncbi:MAG: hypothetical protein SGI73_02140 [Chloroflexota bacterium]|nr:hypothetical protein [Chloroflexota bacterium]